MLRALGERIRTLFWTFRDWLGGMLRPVRDRTVQLFWKIWSHLIATFRSALAWSKATFRNAWGWLTTEYQAFTARFLRVYRVARKHVLERKTLWTVIATVAAIIILSLMVSGYNRYVDSNNRDAGYRRDAIKHCDTDEDCVMKGYFSYDCWYETGCFNVDERPRNDIIFRLSSREGVQCRKLACTDDAACICREKRCVPQC